MLRTPDSTSKAKQALCQEMEIWQSGIREAQGNLQITPADRAQAEQKVAFCETHLLECRKRMAGLMRQSKRQFWFDKKRH